MQMLVKFLCDLYRQWGGVCDDLYAAPDDAAGKVYDTYEANGAPEFSDQDSKDAFLQSLSTLEECLESPANSLPDEVTSNLFDMITGLRKVLGGS